MAVAKYLIGFRVGEMSSLGRAGSACVTVTAFASAAGAVGCAGRAATRAIPAGLASTDEAAIPRAALTAVTVLSQALRMTGSLLMSVRRRLPCQRIAMLIATKRHEKTRKEDGERVPPTQRSHGIRGVFLCVFVAMEM
jgi:hypothetical protein